MEDSGFSMQAVTAAIAGDKEGFQQAFQAALANKVTDALEIKKVEVASNLLGVGQENNEPETVSSEIGGSGDGSAAASDSTES